MVCHKCFEHCSSVLVQWVEAEASWFLPSHNVLHEKTQSTRALFALNIRTLAFHKRQSRSLTQNCRWYLQSFPVIRNYILFSNLQIMNVFTTIIKSQDIKWIPKALPSFFLGSKNVPPDKPTHFLVEFQGLPIWTPGRCHRPECAVPLHAGHFW